MSCLGISSLLRISVSFTVSLSVTSLFILFIVSFGYGPILVYYNPIYHDFIIIVITCYYCFADIA